MLDEAMRTPPALLLFTRLLNKIEAPCWIRANADEATQSTMGSQAEKHNNSQNYRCGLKTGKVHMAQKLTEQSGMKIKSVGLEPSQ